MNSTTTYTPDGLYAVTTAGAGTVRQDDGTDEGERRRDAALDLLRERRAVWVRRAQRALLLAALDAGTATADDVAAAVDLPPDLDGRLLGAAPGALVRAGLLRLAEYTHSRRPTRNASVIAVWQLLDADAALAWLDAHPELPDEPPDLDADQDVDRRQLQLDFDDKPALVAAGAGLPF